MLENNAKTKQNTDTTPLKYCAFLAWWQIQPLSYQFFPSASMDQAKSSTIIISFLAHTG